MWIYIARHAWAHERNASIWPDDSLRELTPAGIQRYRQMAQVLRGRGMAPDRIATSPYVRCRQTAEILADQLAGDTEILELDALIPGTDIESVMHWTVDQACESVVWVGHAPDVSHLAAALIGRPGAQLRFAKGAIAAVRCDGPIQYEAGVLHWLVTAKLLGR